ncbi:MAG: oxidoreductase [Leptothrix sp. (in: b-proteobacteria)]
MNTTTERPIRVALIGHGYVGRTFHAPLIRATAGLELALIGSRDAAAVQAAWPDLPNLQVSADYAGAAVADGIDLVVIATPNDSHHPLARAALLAGKAVVVDKPFTVTLGEAQDLVELAAQRGQLLSVFHNRRWDGDFLTVQQHLASGALGAVREVVSRFDRYDPVPRDRWRERPGPGSGLWFDLGPHLVDQALCLFGAPDWVQADLAALRDRSDGVTDYAQVVLGYVQPARRVTLHCTRLAALGAARFEVHGALGSVTSHGLDVQEDQLKAGLTPLSPGWGADPRALAWMDWRDAAPHLPHPANTRSPREAGVLPRLDGRYAAYYAGIRDALRGHAPNPVPAEEALRTMQVMDLAMRSAEQGRRLAFSR